MKIDDENEFIKLLQFMIETGFCYSPLVSYDILQQNSNATVLRSVDEWSILGAAISEKALPIKILLPVTRYYSKYNDKTIDASTSKDMEYRKKIFTKEIPFKLKLEYEDFFFYSAEDVDFPNAYSSHHQSPMQFNFATEYMKDAINALVANQNIKVKLKNLNSLAVDPFYDEVTNCIYLENKTPQALIDCFLVFLFRQTTTQSKNIELFENNIARFFLFNLLSMPLDKKLILKLKTFFKDNVNEDIDLSNIITRAFKMVLFIMDSLDKECQKILATSNDEQQSVSQNNSFFN